MRLKYDRDEIEYYVNVMKQYRKALDEDPDKAVISFFTVLPPELLGGRLVDEYNLFRDDFTLNLLKRLIKKRLELLESLLEGKIDVETFVVENEWFLRFVEFEK